VLGYDPVEDYPDELRRDKTDEGDERGNAERDRYLPHIGFEVIQQAPVVELGFGNIINGEPAETAPAARTPGAAARTSVTAHKWTACASHFFLWPTAD